MSKGIFVTATGTDVGKTYISALIVKQMRDFGLNCGYYKPVLSGLEKFGDKFVAGDCKFVVDFANLNINPMDCVTYAFQNPVSPHLAAKIEGVPISKDVILNDFNNIKKKYDYLVVEGAGGISCPFNLDDGNLLLTDVIKALNMDIIIVSSSGLGSINQALLTYEYAKAKNIGVKGFILNEFEEDNFMHIDNKKTIEGLTNSSVFTVVKHNDKNLSVDKKVLMDIFREI